MNAPTIQPQQQTIETADGVELAATFYTPTDEPEAVIVINSAIAMPRRFYGEFAGWLASRGHAVITYDYRGIGDSSPEELVGDEASIEDWVERDMVAVIERAEREWATDRLYLVGHSLGGQMMGLLGDRFDIDAAVTFCAQSGYWRLQYPGEESKLWASMTFLVPVVARLCGYLPWSRVFGGEDLPKRVALQWASWCRDPDYLLGDETLANRDGFAEFSAPLLAYSFDDDVWGYKEAVDWMMEQYTAARVERRHVAPEEVGVEEIGHFRFFRGEMDFLWEDVVDWLERQS